MTDIKKIIVILVTAVFVATLLFAVSSAPEQASTSTVHAATSLNVTQQSSSYSSVMQKLESHGISPRYVYLPNFNAQKIAHFGNTVSPTYATTPAPMGIGDIGLKYVNGQIVPYEMNFTSTEASVTVDNLSDFYLLNDGPHSVTIQLNSVLTNVSILGNSSYSFWNQNVVFYSARTHQLTFIDNVWNFSSPAFNMTTNALHGNGFLVPYVFYYDIGPTLNVTYPFTVDLYLNSSVINGNSAVYFNYSVFSSGKVYSGSYDTVIFNSTYGHPGYTAPKPEYQIDGYGYDDTGYLINDAEVMIGGPGGGSTTSVYSINATMHLYYLNSTTGTYQTVPSAFDIAADTGETSEGVAVSWAHGSNGYYARLTAGPSFIYGMWNMSTASSMEKFSGTISPSNAFLFSSPGEMNLSDAAWVPTSTSGHFSFVLPAGTYAYEALMSYYAPASGILGPVNAIELVKDPAMGIYTPLFAMDNQQLANISISGNGSATNPYVVENQQYMPINPLFDEFNDFLFPVFPGVVIANTNASVNLISMPSFYMQYAGYQEEVLKALKLPTYNYLPFEFYNTSNLSLWDDQFISGWFAYFLSGFPDANVILWNSTHDLIGSNTFYSMDSSLLVFGGSDNYIWGNYFLQSPITKTKEFEYINTNGAPFGVSMYSSGNIVYNNEFKVYVTAYSPDYSIYTGLEAIYMDEWNISLQPAFFVHYFNNFALSGSIIGTFYQGGNYWWNFNGTIPYNDNGLIYYGGDYVPLVHGFPFYLLKEYL
ncbi:thermopsin [Thermoplasma sp.]|uniref:thermopsin n=1 Tax=Thermoplasma sp. TaxID=1973142 RepID=UPI00262AABAC|nr:thermopsin [Thermoplasma sp.]